MTVSSYLFEEVVVLAELPDRGLVLDLELLPQHLRKGLLQLRGQPAHGPVAHKPPGDTPLCRISRDTPLRQIRQQ
jgi:hypothetical protein